MTSVGRARPTRPTPAGSSRLRRPSAAIVLPRSLGAPHVARLLDRHRPRRHGDAPPGLRSAIDSVRRARLAGDLLHDWDGPLPDERDGHRMGADAVARDAAGGGVAGVEEDGLINIPPKLELKCRGPYEFLALLDLFVWGLNLPRETRPGVARPRPPKKRKKKPAAENKTPPRELRVGARLADERGEWEVIAPPYSTAG